MQAVPGPAVIREARPEGAPAGSQKCHFCGLWLPLYHRESCPKMPFETWMHTTRRRQVEKHGPEVVRQWAVQCQHCATPFPSNQSKRTHLPGCERRRIEAELALNLYPAIRPDV